MKKVLIITYYWPPAGGPGVQRWLKFAKYLPKFGIEPVIYCPENPNYPIIDHSLLNEIPEDITIVKRSIKEPYRMAGWFSKKDTKTISSGVIPERSKQSLIQKLLLYIRGNFFIPDSRKSWVQPSVAFLSTYLKEQSINTVITTGPPHSMHLIGLQLKKKLGVNWLADFRDPWTTIGYHKELKLRLDSQQKHIALEREVLNQADHVIVTSNHTRAEFEQKTEQPVSVITNGYDSHRIERPEKDTKFSISHIGSLLSERNPLMLWKALKELTLENESFAKHLQINLIGVVSDEVLQSVKDSGLSDFLNVLGYLDHNEAVKAQMRSQLLLLIEIDSEDTKAIIPGKLFEYMVSQTPILAVGPKDSDVEQIIRSTNTGTYFTYDQIAEIKSQILSYFEAYKSDALNVNAIGLQQYSRKALTESLSKIVSQY